MFPYLTSTLCVSQTMSRTVNTTTSRSTTNGHTYYQITKTVTDADGKKHTETVEMVDNEPVRHDDLHEDSRLGLRSLMNPKSLFRSAKPTAAKQSATVQDNQEFVREALQVHNDLRQRHGVEPLRVNNDLCKLAQEWANHLAATGVLKHSKTKYRHDHVGENLRCQSWPVTGKEMTESWYNECKQYDYRNRQQYQSNTGHFTQVVWKNSQEVGFARAQGPSTNFAVAIYYPAGNFLGEYEKNVFPPK